MNAMVAYYSRKGSNKYLAGKIANSLSCEIEEIRPRLNVFLLFLMRINFGIRALKHKPQHYDTVILCGPVWMGMLIPPLKSFLLKYRKHIHQLIFVTCCGSSDEKKAEKFGHGLVFKKMERIMNRKLILCLAFPILLVIPEDKKEDGDLIMKTRLSDENFNGVIWERFDGFIKTIKETMK